MTSPLVFPYMQVVPSVGSAGLMPVLPIELELNFTKIRSQALVDSGSAVNVIPYQMGLQLGADWDRHRINVPLGGMLANHPSKALILRATIPPFQPTMLAFAWSQSPLARLILGQTNFFMEFDVCFFRSQSSFQIQPRTP